MGCVTSIFRNTCHYIRHIGKNIFTRHLGYGDGRLQLLLHLPAMGGQEDEGTAVQRGREGGKEKRAELGEGVCEL